MLINVDQRSTMRGAAPAAARCAVERIVMNIYAQAGLTVGI